MLPGGCAPLKYGLSRKGVSLTTTLNIPVTEVRSAKYEIESLHILECLENRPSEHCLESQEMVIHAISISLKQHRIFFLFYSINNISTPDFI